MSLSIPVEIVNAALTRIGENPVASFDEGSPHANLANVQYESVVRAALSYRWNWATTDAALDLIEGTAQTGLNSRTQYVWQLPSDMILLRSIEVEGTGVDYILRGANRLVTSHDEGVIAVYVYRALEDYWPAFFREAVTQQFEIIYLRSTERWDEARLRAKDLEGTWMMARTLDSQMRTPRRPWRSLLLEARRGAAYG